MILAVLKISPLNFHRATFTLLYRKINKDIEQQKKPILSIMGHLEVYKVFTLSKFQPDLPLIEDPWAII
jgi:hypothetical protein